MLLQEGIVSYRRSLALDFFFASMAQRVSMLAFAVRSDAQRIGRGSADVSTMAPSVCHWYWLHVLEPQAFISLIRSGPNGDVYPFGRANMSDDQ